MFDSSRKEPHWGRHKLKRPITKNWLNFDDNKSKDPDHPNVNVIPEPAKNRIKEKGTRKEASCSTTCVKKINPRIKVEMF